MSTTGNIQFIYFLVIREAYFAKNAHAFCSVKKSAAHVFTTTSRAKNGVDILACRIFSSDAIKEMGTRINKKKVYQSCKQLISLHYSRFIIVQNLTYTYIVFCVFLMCHKVGTKNCIFRNRRKRQITQTSKYHQVDLSKKLIITVNLKEVIHKKKDLRYKQKYYRHSPSDKLS